MSGPFQGVRIIEVADGAAPLHVRLAVAMAGKIASELGADVTVLEPSGGDPIRRLSPFLPGPDRRSALCEFLNGAKTVLALDDPARAEGMMRRADAVLVDASVRLPGDVTAVVVSTFGPGEPELQEAASELTIMAMTGVLHLVGKQAGEPIRLPGHQPAYAAGLAAFLALSAALLASGPMVADVCMLDALLWVNWKILSEQVPSPSADQAVREWQTVPARDGHIALVYMDRDWPALVELVADSRLREPRFATRPSRLENLDALMDVLRPWFAVRRKAEVYREAQQRKIPLGPVWTISDLLRDVQFLERDFLATTSAGVMPRLPVMWNGGRLRGDASVHHAAGSAAHV